MDLLSDVVTSMRSGTPGAARVELHGDWGWYLPGDTEVAGFMAFLEGSCWLFPDAPEGPTKVEAGEIVFSPHGDGCGLASSPARPLETLEEARPGPGGFDRYSFGHPDSRPPVVCLAGGYRMDRERTHPLLTALPQHVFVRDGGPELARVLAGLGEEISQTRPGTDALLPLLLDSLLLYVLRACLETTTEGPSSSWAQALSEPGIGAALAAIHRDPADGWTVTSLAAVARMSRATFARRFVALTGSPPMTYVAWWRMNAARRMLRDTGLSVETVAKRVGYGSPFAFSHAFRQAYGKPPLRYRKSERRQPKRE